MATEETLFLRPQIFCAPPRRPNVPVHQRMQDAVVRRFEIISEAARHFSPLQGLEILFDV